MKISTRALAWLYIFVHILIVASAAVFALLVTLGGFDLKRFVSEHYPRYCDIPTTLAVGIGIVALVFLLISLMAWLSLLKKREWAWWLLISAFSLSTLDLSTSLLHQGLAGVMNAVSAVGHGHIGKFCLLLPNLITIAMLVFDRPSTWRGRSGKKRRRRRRLTRAKSTTKTRRRVVKRR
jgi:uncharacterized membrane protein YhaH (DUF805 family)